MKYIYLSIVSILSIILFTACPDSAVDDYHIWIKNESDQNIAVYLGISKDDGHTLYPNTTLPIFNLTKNYNKNTSRYYGYRLGANISHPDTVCLFVLSQDTIEKYGWNKVKESYNILNRYDLSHKQIKDMNWTFVYK